MPVFMLLLSIHVLGQLKPICMYVMLLIYALCMAPLSVGMARADRTLVEDLFSDGHIQVCEQSVGG